MTSAYLEGVGTGVGLTVISTMARLTTVQGWIIGGGGVAGFSWTVPSDRGAMRGTNSIRPSVVFLYDFPIDPWFAAMAGWCLAICITANFDWFVLHTG